MKLVKRLFLLSFIISLGSLVLDLATTSEDVKNARHIIFDSLMYPLFLFAFFFAFIIIASILLMTLRSNYFKGVTYTFTHWGMERLAKESSSIGNGINSCDLRNPGTLYFFAFQKMTLTSSKKECLKPIVKLKALSN
jgi:hypothetical protein